MMISQWWNFFYLCGASAAGLTGLMFIAATFGTKLIREDNLDKVNAFLSPLCFHFLHIFFLCSMTAVPGASATLLGGSSILSAIWRLIKMPRTYKLVHAEAKKSIDIEISDWLIAVVLPTIVYLTLIVTGIGFLQSKTWAIEILAATCLVFLLGSARGAWDMLIWIAIRLP